MFRTKEIEGFYKEINLKIIYKCLHDKQFNIAKDDLAKIKASVNELSSQDENVLNDIYLLKKTLSFHGFLISTWEEIYEKRYSSSWDSLQNSLDSLRDLNKFSLHNEKTHVLNFFEKQLQILEKIYPYNVFFSMGLEVAVYECSLCGKNIDSFECEHEISELYSGEIAIGIAKGTTDIDHISVVENPKNKRCVVEYSDESHQFKGLQYLNEQLRLNKITPITLYDVDETPRKVPNRQYVKMPRNESCFCGSNKKFKKCCIDKEFTEERHIELIINHDLRLW